MRLKYWSWIYCSLFAKNVYLGQNYKNKENKIFTLKSGEFCC